MRIEKACEKLGFVVLANVFRPDHVHMLVHPLNVVYDMSTFLKVIKQGPSRYAKARDWISTDLWEKGGGYDRNVTIEASRREAISYIHENPVRKEMVVESWRYRWFSANWFLTGEQGDISCCYIGEVWG